MRHRKSPAPLRRRSLVFALLAASLIPATAAIAAEEKAAAPSGGWSIDSNHLGLQRVTTPGIDRDWVEIQDMKRLDEGQPVTRFAIAHTNKITPLHYGNWDQPAPGIKRWRLVLSSPAALSINLGFSRYTLPEGAELTLLDRNGKTQFRSFTAADNDDHGQLWTPLVTGDEVTVVLTVPAKAVDDVKLEIGSINHGYRGLGEIPWFAKSGACNVDVICPEGDDWREQIRSVAALTLFGTDQCSGALVNNTEGDLKGYFLTAAHCDFNDNTNAAGMVAYWDFENSTCRTPGGGPSGGAGDGVRTQFNTGAIFRASRSQSDFALVEFDDPIDPDTTPYWAGIDARDQATSSAVAIHHPSVDEKRISFENDPTTITSYGQNPVPGDGTHIRVTDWDLGTTEGGSSGSPLFSPEKRIIGQLHGGGAACGNNLSDWYGRVAVSWATGTTSATQLKAWLDPNNTGVLTIDGRNEIEAGFNLELDPVAVEVCAIDVEAEVAIAVTQEDVGFVDPVTLTAVDLPPNATAGFATNPVVPGNGTTLTLGALDQVAAGSYMLGVEGTDGVDIVAKSLSLNLATAAPAAATLTAPANAATGVSTTASLSWSAAVQATGYRVVVDNNSDFSSPVFDEVVTATTVNVPGLSVNTQYSWRVTTQNACGDGALSTVFTFTTGAQYCDLANLAIPDNVPAGVQRTIVIPESAEITDLQLGLTITHTWMGDIIATLSKDGTTQAVFNRPGVPASTNGCNGNNADIVLDDAATLVAETNCTAGANPTAAYIVGEHYQPNVPLAAFDGMDLAGTWTLTVSDNVGADLGTLDSWCLIPATLPFANEPPVAGPLADVDVLVGEALNYDAGAAFSDPNNDDLVFTAPALPAWASINAATGVITGTPAAADVGDVLVTVTATEDHPDLGSDSATFTLTVTPLPNDPPEAGTLADVEIETGDSLNYDAGAAFSDPDSDDLVFTAPALPAWATIDSATGAITGVPAAGDIGDTVVTVRATEDHPDAGFAEAAFTLSVIAANEPPGVTPIPDQSATVEVPYTLDAGAAFVDPNGDALTFTQVGLPAWASLDPATGEITGTPALADVGEVEVTITATEDHPDAGSIDSTFILTVAAGNAAPVAGTIADVTIQVGVALALDAGEAFSDADGDTLIFSATGLPAWADIDPVTGAITGTPGAGDEGEAVITVTATEDTPDALSASTDFTLTVVGEPIFADGFED